MRLPRPNRERFGVAACLLVSAAAALLIPGGLGLLLAPAVFIASRRFVLRLPAAKAQPPSAHVLAAAVELLAACLDAGALPADALAVTGGCAPGPVGDELKAAGEAMARGASAEEALPEAGALAPLAAVLRRSARTGSTMTDQLIAIAEQLRADEQFAQLERARRVSVQSALPLGLCMLPAFVLLSVVPAVSGLGAGLLR